MKYIFYIMSFLLIDSSFAQEIHVPASPLCGWDSLKMRMDYPNIAARAGLEERAEVSFNIDSTGDVSQFTIHRKEKPEEPIQNIFENCIMKAFQSTKWIPEKIDGKPRQCTLFFTIDFLMPSNIHQYHFLFEAHPILQYEQIGH
jgi:outer membrane biosynthesis protein TonB